MIVQEIDGLSLVWYLNDRAKTPKRGTTSVLVFSKEENNVSINAYKDSGWVPLKNFVNTHWGHHHLTIMGNFKRSTHVHKLPFYSGPSRGLAPPNRFHFPACCGLHLVLEQEGKITPRSSYPTLVWGAGRFRKSPGYIMLYSSSTRSLYYLAPSRSPFIEGSWNRPKLLEEYQGEDEDYSL